MHTWDIRNKMIMKPKKVIKGLKFPKLMKDTKPQIQETQITPNRLTLILKNYVWYTQA